MYGPGRPGWPGPHLHLPPDFLLYLATHEQDAECACFLKAIVSTPTSFSEDGFGGERRSLSRLAGERDTVGGLQEIRAGGGISSTSRLCREGAVTRVHVELDAIVAYGTTALRTPRSHSVSSCQRLVVSISMWRCLVEAVDVARTRPSGDIGGRGAARVITLIPAKTAGEDGGCSGSVMLSVGAV